MPRQAQAGTSISLSTLFSNALLVTLLAAAAIHPVYASSNSVRLHDRALEPPQPVSCPLRRRQASPQQESNNALVDIDVNVSLDGDNSATTQQNPPLLQVRLANIDRLNWIKNRVSSKWSSHKDEDGIPAKTNELRQHAVESLAMERANKRAITSDILARDEKIKKVIKRQDQQQPEDGGSGEVDTGNAEWAPFPPSAEDPSSSAAAAETAASTTATTAAAAPTLAQSRGSNISNNDTNAPATGSSSNNEKSKVKLHDDVTSGEDIEYLAAISVGNPPQSFEVIVDTGSADMWLQGTTCNNCSTAPRFETSNSTTIKDQRRDFDIAYGIGSTSGEVYKDSVSVAGKMASRQSFAVADQMSSDWTNQPASGLLGLGFQTNSKIGDKPFFQTLVDQGVVPEAKFAFAFGRQSSGSADQSSFMLGGVDSTKYQGDITYLPVSTTRWYWQLQVDSINALGQKAVVPREGYVKEVVIDTGSTLIAGPKEEVDAFWKTVPNATYSEAGGYWAYPCASKIEASFSFTGSDKPLVVSDEDLNFGQVNIFSDKCVGAIIPGNTSGFWILGLAFLKNYYTVFDAGNYQIGFATPTY